MILNCFLWGVLITLVAVHTLDCLRTTGIR
ncbi:hypothetical protein LCGC14_2238070 [marine sediment metagenome]|uniref:Uncharacterized protein n=1 Tax=marine sediment metagenome TaxID=412755 RepID=A0A0F9G1A7_9ZZZZ